MPSIAAEDTSLHGVQLPAGAEVVVTLAGAPRFVTVVVTTPGSAPIYWNAADRLAEIAGADCRVIPGGLVASDSDSARRVPLPEGGVEARVHLISAAQAVVSIQRGV